jgi:predicted metal-dependent peptidase
MVTAVSVPTIKGMVTRVKLTPQQEKLWSDTRVALLWHCPAFTHIFYTLLDRSGSEYIAVFTEDIPIAATDGSCILFNPKTFFALNLQERLFVTSHEILHCIMNHMILMHGFRQRGKVAFSDGTELDYDHETMNVAMDLVINDLLVESGIGQMPTQGCHDTKLATGQDSSIDTYRKIFKKQHGQGGKGFDTHMAPGNANGQDPNQAAQGRNESEWNTQLAAAANSARAQGKLPAGLERLIDSILNPKVDWRDKIRTLFARKVGSGSYDWRRPDRRLIVRDIHAPGRSGFGAGTIVVAVDTSGSIGDKEVAMFFAEMSGILEDVRPRKMFVVWCDAKVHRVDEIDEAVDLAAIQKRGAPGGGGTAFEPVFDWINDEMLVPDALVYLTDGYGSFPQTPPAYHVIWGSITPEGGVNYPFGDVVEVPNT